MTDDPRAQIRRHPYYDRGIFPTQVDERVKRALSPADDEDPFAQAVRSKEETDRDVASYRRLRLRRQGKAPE